MEIAIIILAFGELYLLYRYQRLENLFIKLMRELTTILKQMEEESK
jgi:hypothetical protein